MLDTLLVVFKVCWFVHCGRKWGWINLCICFNDTDSGISKSTNHETVCKIHISISTCAGVATKHEFSEQWDFHFWYHCNPHVYPNKVWILCVSISECSLEISISFPLAFLFCSWNTPRWVLGCLKLLQGAPNRYSKSYLKIMVIMLLQ